MSNVKDLKFINQLIDKTADKNGVLPVPFSKTTVRRLLFAAMEAQREACEVEANTMHFLLYNKDIPEEIRQAILNAKVQL